MPKKGHTEQEIIAALKQQEAGDKTVDICASWASDKPLLPVEEADAGLEV